MIVKRMKLIDSLVKLLSEAGTPPVDGGVLTSKYNERRNGKQHKAIDIAVNSGSKIKSPFDGYIVVKENSNISTGFHNNSCGGTIIIKHTNGFTSSFCHVKEIYFTENGTKVKKGDVVGLTGGGKNDKGKGYSTGPHLHFVLRDETGKKVNPTEYISFDFVTDMPKETNIMKTKDITIDDILENGNNSQLIGYGSQGEGVSEVQEILKDKGYDLGEGDIDGIFGPDTKKAVKNFQKDEKLKLVDGIVGIETSIALNKYR